MEDWLREMPHVAKEKQTEIRRKGGGGGWKGESGG